MNRPLNRPPSPAAGGFLIALGLLGGGAMGMTQGNAQIWFLIGAAAGVTGAVIVWLIDRQR